MEYMNCEQYVLGELEAAQAENERLQNEVARLQVQCQLLEERMNAQPSRIERWATKKGRESLFNNCTGCVPNVTGSDGERVSLDVFCEGYIRDYSLPKWLSKAEFARYFEPEFRKAYEDAIAEEQE